MNFGELVIELDRLLNESRIVAKKGNKVVMKQRVPLDIIDLVMRRKTVIPELLDKRTKEVYRKLHRLSGKGMDKLDKQIILIDNPEDAFERLELLLGSQRAGNDSKKLRNDIVLLKDYLLKNKVITKQEYDDL